MLFLCIYLTVGLIIAIIVKRVIDHYDFDKKGEVTDELVKDKLKTEYEVTDSDMKKYGYYIVYLLPLIWPIVLFVSTRIFIQYVKLKYEEYKKGEGT